MLEMLFFLFSSKGLLSLEFDSDWTSFVESIITLFGSLFAYEIPALIKCHA